MYLQIDFQEVIFNNVTLYIVNKNKKKKNLESFYFIIRQTRGDKMSTGDMLDKRDI